MRDYLKRFLENFVGSRSAPTQPEFAPRGISHHRTRRPNGSRLQAPKLEAHTAGRSVNDMHNGPRVLHGIFKT